MATEYSLLTCLGRDGKTVTMTIASPCVVSLTAHGMPDGHPIRFTTTGALPTGLSTGVTYYVKSPSANSFNVAATNGGTAINTSGSQSGTHKAIGEYWATLPATDPGNGGNYRARYGAAGSERCYETLYAWKSAVYVAQNAAKAICLEIQGKWTDTSSTYVSGYILDGFYSIEITTKINGIYDPESFHFGVAGAGWIKSNSGQYDSTIQVKNSNAIIDGIEVINTYSGGSPSGSAIRWDGVKCHVRNCIGHSAILSAFCEVGSASIVSNCLALSAAKTVGTIGFRVSSYSGNGSVYNNNLANGHETGFKLDTPGTNNKSIFINNIAYGNTTNWGTPGTGYRGYNAGESGDSPWDSGSTALTNLVAGDFDTNFKPASSSSHQVNTGTNFVDLPAYDCANMVRPNYESSTYPNNTYDVGPFEYDHGEGLAPSTVNISITGMASGSEIAIYKVSDMSEILAPQSTTGSYTGTYTYTGDTSIIVRVRKGTSATRYLPYEYAGTITSIGFQLVVSQIPDAIAQ